MRNYLLTVSVGLFVCACNSGDIAEQVGKETKKSNETVH